MKVDVNELGNISKEILEKSIDIEKFQNIVEMLCEIYEASCGAVVHFRKDVFQVFTTSKNEDNFLNSSSSWPVDAPSFCRVIAASGEMLYVSDAKNSPYSHKIPAVFEGPVRSYLGYPIFWPDDSLFGSLCVIDTKATNYSSTFVKLLGQLKEVIESELKHIVDYHALSVLSAKEQFLRRENENVISDKEAIKEALELQESINSAALSSLVESVIRIDSQGTILSANPSTFSLFGYSKEELIGHNVIKLMEEKEAHQHDSYIKNYLESGEKKVIGSGRKVTGLKKNRDTFPAHLSVTEIPLKNESQFIGVIHDMTVYEDQRLKLESLAWFDPLTHCRNRAYLWDRISKLISKYERHKRVFTVVYIDLDKFKPINDIHGHKAGDYVLTSIAERLASSIRLEDTLARVGGDEFVILFENDIDSSIVINKLRTAVEQEILFQNQKLKVSASFGVSCYPSDGSEVDQLIDSADKRMYLDKQR